MSREIKFRGWVRSQKKMTKPLTIEEICVQWSKPYNWCDLMQFTGLTDRNGVPIFEGDIVEQKAYPFYSDALDEPPTFKKRNYLGVVEWFEEDAMWYMGLEVVSNRVRGGAIGGYLAQYKGLEVIGNIYENPELLQEQDSEQ